ncbi:MAG: 1-deoxy-D-xylulose-5-phosphate synthase [Bacteroidia bacterium]|nr:1-deoxy-D-xylulose-5-phosphate synthase [Bacteroidia bacterium]
MLHNINEPSDLKKLATDQLPQLCSEIREFFIDKILKNGGHFSANLGVVELTVALHYIYDFKVDKLIWDVGHQAYIHKILTGRKKEFDRIRKLGGLAGFPKMSESEYDHFGTGHSSTSISAILGMAEAAILDQKKHKHIAVIGDGSLTGGMAFEALNNLGTSNSNVLVIINDNQIGIDPNSGAINHHLNTINENVNFFKTLGLEYEGPIDGHDLNELITSLEKSIAVYSPKILHIRTVKGKGYLPAEKAQTDWHSVSYVKIDPSKAKTDNPTPSKFQDVFGYTLLELAERDPRIVGITPAMPSGSSMKILMDAMPHRVFDVGIAEQHAVTFSAGLAATGKRPFCSIYSSFAQRAYDQIIHDVALQNIPVVFCIDRAGLVGADGPTHHGSFDIAYLNAIPNLTIISPMDEHELRNAMYWAVDHIDGPVVIRYPRGLGSKTKYKNEIQPLKIGTSRILQKGDQIGIISIGEIGIEVQKAINKSGIHRHICHIDARFVKPIDNNEILNMLQTFDHIITVEESCLIGGFGQQIKTIAQDYNYTGKITSLGLPDQFIEQGTREELRAKYNLDKDGICQLIQAIIPKK